MKIRSVFSVRKAHAERIGDLETRNPLDGPDPAFDPFLILGHHGPQLFPPNNTGMPFRDHPHRGFETVTFVLEGCMLHTDSSGQRRLMEKGGVQWMTAGAGIVHNEQVPPEFMKQGGLLEIVQLWVNLPARLKTASPAYVGVPASAMTTVMLDDGRGTLRLVSGKHDQVAGPIEPLTDVFMSHVTLDAGAHVHLPAPQGRTVLLYVMHGDIEAAEHAASGGDLVRWTDDGDVLEIVAASDTSFLFAHADPIGEPVATGGPFVMNTQAEVAQAFRDYREGAFDTPVVARDVA